MAEELLEAEAIEEESPAMEAEEPSASPEGRPRQARPLPERRPEPGEVSTWSDEVKTAAIAAAGGLVAGAATVAAVRVARGAASSRRRPSSRLLSRQRPLEIVASRSVLVDIHLLGR